MEQSTAEKATTQTGEPNPAEASTQGLMAQLNCHALPKNLHSKSGSDIYLMCYLSFPNL